MFPIVTTYYNLKNLKNMEVRVQMVILDFKWHFYDSVHIENALSDKLLAKKIS